MLRLYDYKPAPSPRRIRMLLAEKSIKYECIQVDLAQGEQMAEGFKAINPRCTVPALEIEDGTILTENAGIAAYLEARFPEPPMLGTTPIEKGLIAEWNWRCEYEGLSAGAEALRNSSPHMKDRALTGTRNVQQLEELAERGRKRMGWFFEDLNSHLENSQFIAGDNFSIADITSTICVDFARWVKVYPQESHTALLAWHERMKARSSYKA